MSQTAPVSRRDPVPARCPECTWRSGPFATPQAAHEATVAHAKLKHAGLMALVTGTPLPDLNDTMARQAAGALLRQGTRITQVVQGASRISGPDGKVAEINLADELRRFIQNTNQALIALLDVVLEMRTGRPLVMAAPSPEEAQKAAGEASAELPAEIAAPATEEAKAS
jgi:hypothetical protein